jgi:hypothetical protein
MIRSLWMLLAAACAASPQAPPELRDVRQLTSDGTHAEAYWSFDGTRIVLMGERSGDPADQIYELEVSTGKLARISPGQGKAT